MAGMKIKKGDTVVILAGKSKGKTGQVIKAIPTDMKVVVAGCNTVKCHRKPTQESPGGIVEKEMPIHVSNVALIDPKTKKATRVGYKVEKDGTKKRIAKRSGSEV